jgi:Flp pilus assembly protein TadD
LKPDFAAGYFNLGRVAAAEGRLEEAVANFRESMRLRPQDAEAHESLARTLARQGKVDEARLHFQEAVRLLKKGR